MDEIDVVERDEEGRPLCYINKSGRSRLQKTSRAVRNSGEAEIAEWNVEVHIAGYVRH